MEHRSTTSFDPPDPRILFAAERTLLAWIRTGLALMGFGFVVARFGLFLREIAVVQNASSHPPGDSLAIGVGLVGLGVAVMAGAGWRYRRYVAALAAGPQSPRLPGRPSASPSPHCSSLRDWGSRSICCGAV